jgi:hypothetical protein
MDIWRTRQVAGQPLQVENLGATINSNSDDYDPCVDPHGKYLLFASARSGSANIYVSFSNGNGGWNTPVNMDTIISGFNTGGADGPSISPDGRYLFWRRVDDGQGTYQNIYWVSNPFFSQLAISLNNTNVNLSWSTNYPGFVLEGTGDLTGGWTTVPGVTGYSAALPVVPGTNQFFRLRK